MRPVVSIIIIDDNRNEANEYFVVSLSATLESRDAVRVGNGSLCLIVDDDCKWSVTSI